MSKCSLTTAERSLVQAVWSHYAVAGRHDLPWRRAVDPYRIVVSEVMLQQTQVVRVVPKYTAFIRKFSNTKQLAVAPLSAVLVAWQGLGYNRRAKMLHACAQHVHAQYNGRWPRSYDAVRVLPGIGPYTAGAVMAFAYNTAVPMIETNIRTVYLHHIFSNQTDVSEATLLHSVERTLDTKRPREWYWALMDYGAHLKKTVGNNIRRARDYQPQSRFEGSVRQVRGAVLRYLSCNQFATLRQLEQAVAGSAQLPAVLIALEREGLIIQTGSRWCLPA